ncbi:flagellin [Cognatishimia sp. F0-27]|uniref:flagellin n=1 Tax=Cognatishimia sp. F0-27 TaxID=2816855 RepID=UPI001D0C7C04|nr:flagellin [Cognatishimia sp. F0-27]MCC1493298.1 flagellin [Cognatishimia sp. F0-27]
MSSILTNNGAMVALKTLRTINNDLDSVRSEISTGKKVGSASDNAAVFAISKAMESDVRGFKAVSDSLSLGQATVSVARQGAETVTDLLTEIKGKIVSAQGEGGGEPEKIQADIDALVSQIGDIVDTASFNGANLLKNTSTEEGSGTTSVMSSIDRSDSGVTTSEIDIRKRDLTTGASAIAATGGTFTASEATGTVNATEADIDLSGVDVEAGKAFSLQIFGTDADDSAFTQADLRNTAAAAGTQGEAAGGDITYVARDGDTMADVAKALSKEFAAYANENGIDSDTLSISAAGESLVATSNVTDGTDTIAVTVMSVGADAGNTIGGGLEGLESLSVLTEDDAAAALSNIEGLISASIDAAASFGSDQGRLETQKDFIAGLTDALKSGIGTLTDADMTEASARLQALEVQQQLATQSLSIANRAPQSLLSLFR